MVKQVFVTTTLGQGGTAAATEVLCYRTAVVVEPLPSSSGNSA